MGISEISLTAGMRSNLFSLKTTSTQVDRTQERLSSGKKVNSALDNPTNFFAAQSHLHRAADITVLKDGIAEATQVVKTADIGMGAMTELFRTASAIAEMAVQSKNYDELSKHVDQYNEMRYQVDKVASDSWYRGTNLLHREDLTVDFGNNHNLVIKGHDVTSSGFDRMTNGLNVESAKMDPLHIVTPNYVTTKTGEIKENGELSFDLTNVRDIDRWLGDEGIRNQILTSSDVRYNISESIIEGNVTSDLLDIVAQAEFGTDSVTFYRRISMDATSSQPDIVQSANISSSLSSYANFGQLMDPFQTSGTSTISFTRNAGIGTYETHTEGNGRLSPVPQVGDSNKLTEYLTAKVSNQTVQLEFDAGSNAWSLLAPGDLIAIPNANPASSFEIQYDNETIANIHIQGSWDSGDRIEVELGGVWASDQNSTVKARETHQGIIFERPGGSTDARINLSIPTNQVAFGAGFSIDASADEWVSGINDVKITQPDNNGLIQVDLNNDGQYDMLVHLPTSSGAAWRPDGMVTVRSQGPFVSNDPTVTAIKYDHTDKKIMLQLYAPGNSGNTDITINLETENWAAYGIPQNTQGNGDKIYLTIDGRHRWAKADGSPNPPGMRLAMQEIKDAIDTMRIYSAQNSSDMSILKARNNFINDLTNTLLTGADNLTLADMNEESANMLMLETRKQLGINSLSLSGQASQSIMRLF